MAALDGYQLDKKRILKKGKMKIDSSILWMFVMATALRCSMKIISAS